MAGSTQLDCGRGFVELGQAHTGFGTRVEHPASSRVARPALGVCRPLAGITGLVAGPAQLSIAPIIIKPGYAFAASTR